ncbi:MAG TPA: thioredoxin family protein [Pirellulales bacterium]|nr:thioredoxin family protein [Pirellulales bacterium]
MTYQANSQPEPTREEVDQMEGAVLLEFGAAWCGHCQTLQPELAEALAKQPEVRHVKIEDGKGKPLGRSFRVKLWPTLVFMLNGQVLKQVSRPSFQELGEGMELLRKRCHL